MYPPVRRRERLLSNADDFVDVLAMNATPPRSGDATPILSHHAIADSSRRCAGLRSPFGAGAALGEGAGFFFSTTIARWRRSCVFAGTRAGGSGAEGASTASASTSAMSLLGSPFL